MLNALERAIQRKATKAFIDADPTEIVLKSRVDVFTAGTKNTVPGTDLPPQTFKLIWESQSGLVNGPPNGSRRFDFVLVGEHDADISIGNFWKDGDQEHRVVWVSPSNDYEVVAGGFSYGPSPT